MGDFEKPIGKPYEGLSGAGRDSYWLTAEDLPADKEVQVTIETALIHDTVKFEGGRTKTDYIGLKFVGKEKVLGLNATNRKALFAMFGNVTKDWRGKQITLYVGETHSPRVPKGQTEPCVRIKNLGRRSVSNAAAALQGAPAPKPAAATGPAAREPGEDEDLDLMNSSAGPA